MYISMPKTGRRRKKISEKKCRKKIKIIFPAPIPKGGGGVATTDSACLFIACACVLPGQILGTGVGGASATLY